MKKQKLKIKLNDIINRKQIAYAKYQQFKHKNNTTKEIMSRIDAELIVFNSVLDALNNNDVLINTY